MWFHQCVYSLKGKIRHITQITICIFKDSSKKQNQCMYTHIYLDREREVLRLIYYKELTHVIMKAGTSGDLGEGMV